MDTLVKKKSGRLRTLEARMDELERLLYKDERGNPYPIDFYLLSGDPTMSKIAERLIDLDRKAEAYR
jgi:hypothetical protein